VGKFLLFAHEAPIDLERLAFVMKYLGYRFQNHSLLVALSYEPDVAWAEGARYRVHRNEETLNDLYRRGFAPHRRGFDTLVGIARAWCAAALAEYEQRLK